jgi:hypothetical protein
MTKNFFYQVLTLLLWISCPVVHGEEQQRGSDYPPCGIASTFGIIHCLGGEVTIAEINWHFKELYPDFNPEKMSLSQLDGLIKSFSYHTLAVQVDLHNIAPTYLPAILCITQNPNGEKMPIGHVVILRKIEGNNALITDFQAGQGTRSIPLKELLRFTDGEMLLVSQKPISLPLNDMRLAGQLTIFTGIIGLIIIFLPKKRNFGKKKISVNFFCFLIITLFSVGCIQNNKANAPILLKEQMKNHGIFRFGIEGERIEFLFSYKVWEKSSVVIKDVQTSCGCLVPDRHSFGNELKPESEHLLKLVMDAHGRSGSHRVQALIITEPPLQEPIVLIMEAFVVQLPHIAPMPLVIQGKPNQKISSTTLNINYLRDKSLSKLQ